jgi:hypothetical protein
LDVVLAFFFRSMTLSGDWTRFITPAPDGVFVELVPPSHTGDPLRRSLMPTAYGWRGDVPASDGPAGIWVLAFHVRGVWAGGSETGDLASPAYSMEWGTGSLGVTAFLESEGTGVEAWGPPNILGG